MPQGAGKIARGRFSDAESHRDHESRDFFEKLVESFHDGRYEKELAGDGTFDVDSSPAGATVTLHRLEEKGLVLSEADARELGTTPTGPLPAPMGSYLATVSKDGYEATRYPIWISRNREWSGTVRLFKTNEIPRGFVHVPRGPFDAGGDDEVRGWSLPASQPELPDFSLCLEDRDGGGGAPSFPSCRCPGRTRWRFASGVRTKLD